MALLFGAAAANRVTFGSAGIITDLFTICVWVFPTSFANGSSMYAGPSNTGSLSSVIQLKDAGGVGAYQFTVSRGVATANFQSNTSPMVAGQYNFIAATYDFAGGMGHLYRGDLATNAAEVGYASSTVGAGAIVDQDGADGNLWGARWNGGAATDSFRGRIAYGMIFSRMLTLPQIIVQQFAPARALNIQAYHQLGYVAPTAGPQPDWSGKGLTGTITGATVVAHVPDPPVVIVPPVDPSASGWRRMGLRMGVGV